MLRNLVKIAGYKHEEEQYLAAIRDLIDTGSAQEGRNGTTICDVGAAMVFSLKDGKIPLMTTKQLAWKTCLKELLWFIKGSTDNVELTSQKCNIWNGNSTREYLDSRGLTSLKENDLGPVYGFQWRHFNGEYVDCHTDYSGVGVDQLAYIIDALKGDEAARNSRRLVMTAWNPCQLDKMALPPCHLMCQFHVTNKDELTCTMYQRSGDMGLGVPFNIASYSFLTHLIAFHCGLKAKEFVYYLGNVHIYDDHVEPLKEQLKRSPYEFPTLEIIGEKRANIEDYKLDDFILKDYVCHPSIKMEMRV
jgi:thymidylate synthase